MGVLVVNKKVCNSCSVLAFLKQAFKLNNHFWADLQATNYSQLEVFHLQFENRIHCWEFYQKH